MSAITIYTTPTCPYCLAAKALLKKKGLSYEEINVQSDRATALTTEHRLRLNGRVRWLGKESPEAPP